MEEHYTQEDMQYITMESTKPLMNSFKYHFALMDGEFFKGKVKINNNAGMVMNIAFRDGEEPDLEEGQFSTWTYDGEEESCRVIRKKRFYIKGVYVVLFVVQLKE